MPVPVGGGVQDAGGISLPVGSLLGLGISEGKEKGLHQFVVPFSFPNCLSRIVVLRETFHNIAPPKYQNLQNWDLNSHECL